MTTITENATVGELVAQRPSRSRVFEKLGIDYCCGGKKKLVEACAAKGLDATALVEALKSMESSPENEPGENPAAMSLAELAGHIEATHHAYLRRELPRLTEMAGKVAKVHGNKDARLAELKATVDSFAGALNTHMAKEEHVLFPAIRQIEGAAGKPAFPFGQLANPIHCMEQEHDDAGEALARMRQLTDEYTPPDWACNTYRALLDGLNELEWDMHQHVHKENNILFPKAVELEQRLLNA